MALPLAIASARKRICQHCRLRCHRSSWQHYRCTYDVEKSADQATGPECSDAFWQDEDSRCPAGLWDRRISVQNGRIYAFFADDDHDIGPLDTAAYEAELAAAQRERLLEHQRRQKPMFELLLQGHNQATVDALLEKMVEKYGLTPEVATEISDELEARNIS